MAKKRKGGMEINKLLLPLLFWQAPSTKLNLPDVKYLESLAIKLKALKFQEMIIILQLCVEFMSMFK